MKPIIQGGLDALSRRSSALEADVAALKSRQTTSALSGTIDAGLTSLSASVDAHFNQLSGSVDGHFNQLSGTIDARFVSLSGSVDSAWKAGDATLSGTINARIVSLSGSVDSAWKSGDATLSGTIDAKFVSLSGTIDGHFSQLSGTVDAQRAWDGLDHMRGFALHDDFVNDLLGTYTSSGVTGDPLLFPAWEAGHPGIVTFRVNNSASYSFVYGCGTSAENSVNIAGGGGRTTVEGCVRVPTLSNGTNNTRVLFGIADAAATPPGNSAAFEYNLSRYGNHNWRLVMAATGSRVETNTGVVVGTNVWTRLVIEVAENADAVTGSIFVTGSMVGQLMTRTFIPNVAASPTVAPFIVAQKTLGAGDMSAQADYMRIRVAFTGSRI